MAATITELNFIRKADGRCRLEGTLVTAGGTTSGIIKPGSNDVNMPGSASLRAMRSWGLTNNVSSAAFKAVKTYDTTQDGHILTVTCTANDAFDFWIEGDDNGA